MRKWGQYGQATTKFSPEVRAHAMRMVLKHEADIELSVANADHNYDNALIETIDGFYKAEEQYCAMLNSQTIDSITQTQ